MGQGSALGGEGGKTGKQGGNDLPLRDLADRLSVRKKEGLTAPAGNAEVGLTRFSRAVDDAAPSESAS